MTAAIYHRRLAKGLSLPRLPFGARCMMNERKIPKDDFLPRSAPAVCLGPSELVPGAYIMLREGTDKLEVTGNIQLEGKRNNLNDTLFDLLIGPPDELLKFESPQMEVEPVLPRRWSCPACRGQHRNHTRVFGKCALSETSLDWVDEFTPDLKPGEPEFPDRTELAFGKRLEVQPLSESLVEKGTTRVMKMR